MRIGWPDADPEGPNGSEVSELGLRRVPLADVPLGFGRRAPGASLTRESAKNRAMLWLPAVVGALDVVLLHLHGHNLGWRHDLRASRGGPRDLHRDRIGAQLAACGRRAAAALPQGGLHSEFAPGPFDAEAYLVALREAAEKLGETGALGTVATPVVVSAHSGGGTTLASMLSGRTRARLPWWRPESSGQGLRERVLRTLGVSSLGADPCQQGCRVALPIGFTTCSMACMDP